MIKVIVFTLILIIGSGSICVASEISKESTQKEDFVKYAASFDMVAVMEIRNNTSKISEVLYGSSKDFKDDLSNIRVADGTRYLYLWSKKDANFKIYLLNKNFIRFGVGSEQVIDIGALRDALQKTKIEHKSQFKKTKTSDRAGPGKNSR
jgi:hypothetical protein